MLLWVEFLPILSKKVYAVNVRLSLNIMWRVRGKFCFTPIAALVEIKCPENRNFRDYLPIKEIKKSKNRNQKGSFKNIFIKVFLGIPRDIMTSIDAYFTVHFFIISLGINSSVCLKILHIILLWLRSSFNNFYVLPRNPSKSFILELNNLT